MATRYVAAKTAALNFVALSAFFALLFAVMLFWLTPPAHALSIARMNALIKLHAVLVGSISE